MRIVTLTTCHNRKSKTLNALNDLHNQNLSNTVTLEHVVVDDGSTDGTADAVMSQFPDVEIVTGTGNLFWAGGMRYGWETTVKRMTFDYLFVYNDDVRLDLDAIARLVDTSSKYIEDGGVSEHVVVGAFRSDISSETSYSGLVRSSRWHPLRFRRLDPLSTSYVEVDTLNMNSCLIKREAIEKVGFLSAFFKHGGADFEYGLKLRKCGGAVLLAPGYLGSCERNEAHDVKNRTLLGSYKELLNCKNQPPMQRFKYYTRHGGWLWPILWAAPYVTHVFKYFKSKI